MVRHAVARDPLHVFYVGSSADLGALRRLMEAHGAITRSRLTPEVTVVIADSSVPTCHPVVRAAGTLGIPVMKPAEATAHFAQWRSRTETGSSTQTQATLSPAAEPAPAERVRRIRPAIAGRRSWPFRRRSAR